MDKWGLVRVQDRLMYFIKAICAFSPDTVRGLIYIYARGFITITRVSHPLQSVLFPDCAVFYCTDWSGL